MQNLIIKIKKTISEIESEKGAFTIKCLIARNPDDIQWDLILAADWFETDQIERFNYLSEKILGDLDIDCISQFSGIVTISPNSDLARFISKLKNKMFLKKIHLDEDEIIETKNQQAPMIVLLQDEDTLNDSIEA